MRQTMESLGLSGPSFPETRVVNRSDRRLIRVGRFRRTRARARAASGVPASGPSRKSPRASATFGDSARCSTKGANLERTASIRIPRQIVVLLSLSIGLAMLGSYSWYLA